MRTFLIVFFALAGMVVYAIKTTRAIDQVEAAEWEAVTDRHKMEMCREAILDDACGYRCGSCPWHVEEETEDLTDDR